MNMIRALLFFFVGCAATSGLLLADTAVITIPAAASIVGVAPFYSDVRVFNTSYASSVEITATYRCFLGSCPSATARETFTLSPRQSKSFDDMVRSAFDAPNSAGAVEFAIGSGIAASDVVVTSRLYSTSPTPTVGMFIPGLPPSAAHRYAVLTQISNAAGNTGFRTNVGAFNPEDTAATVIFSVSNGGAFVGSVQRTLAPHAGTQISDIFGPGGIHQPSLETSNAVITVQTNGPAVFSYAAVIDNSTTDPIFVSGASDSAPVLSVGGTYPTDVALVPGQNTCGPVTVEDAVTTVAQTPGSHTLSLTHAGNTYTGTVEDDGRFSTQPKTLTSGSSQFTITIAGQFSPSGFTATVQVDVTQTGPPPTCSYQVSWVGTKS
jgi:hypothetical protein